MRETTRRELLALCSPVVENPSDEAAVAALWTRAPYGTYYVRDDKGVPVYLIDADEKAGTLAVQKADKTDKKSVSKKQARKATKYNAAHAE